MTHAASHIANVRYAIRNIVTAASKLEAVGREVLHCNIGDPLKYDFPTPPHLIAAVDRAMRDGANGYVPSAGIAAARDAVATEARGHGMSHVTANDVFITAGASEAIDLSLTAIVEPGDELLLPSPGYPLYNAIAARLKATVVEYFPDEDRNWSIDPEEIASRVTKRTKAIILCNPNNPTGAVLSRKDLEGILEVARRHNLVVLSDEIYAELLFEGRHTYTGSLATDVPIIMFNGLSKAYLACGWRIGWLVFVNPSTTTEIAAAVRRLSDARICGVGPFQFAVAPALQGPKTHIVQMLEKLRRRREVTVEAIRGIKGLSLVPPAAAFYAMPRIDEPSITDDERFVLDLLEETGVLFVHGSGFGEKPGTRHFRIVFLPPEETLRKAYQKLAAFMAKRVG